MKGRVFDIYDKIGIGQFSNVYRVRYGEEKKVYAVKIINTGSLDKHYISNEIRLGSMINHKNIVRIEFMMQISNSFYIAMELIDGRSLDRILFENYFSEQHAKIYAFEIAKALHYLHANGLVHRDLKASNIMISKKGLKLIDLGTISLADEIDVKKSTIVDHYIPNSIRFTVDTLEKMDLKMNCKFCCGTKIYLAPEGYKPFVSSKLDIWAFACLIYRMVTGIEISTTIDINDIHLMCKKNNYEFLNDNLSPELIYLLKNMLRYKHAERYDIEKVMKSEWFEPLNKIYFKLNCCVECDANVHFADENFFILCKTCEKTRFEKFRCTTQKPWEFYDFKSLAMKNSVLMKNKLRIWNHRQTLTNTQISNLMHLSSISMKSANQLGTIYNDEEISEILDEKKEILEYFDEPKSCLDIFSTIRLIFRRVSALFNDSRVFLTRLNISRLNFLINDNLLRELNKGKKDVRQFDYFMRMYERDGITKLVVTRKKGLKCDFEFMNAKIKAVIAKLERINQIERI